MPRPAGGRSLDRGNVLARLESRTWAGRTDRSNSSIRLTVDGGGAHDGDGGLLVLHRRTPISNRVLLMLLLDALLP